MVCCYEDYFSKIWNAQNLGNKKGVTSSYTMHIRCLFHLVLLQAIKILGWFFLKEGRMMRTILGNYCYSLAGKH